jgi:spore germination cell wall hydrolase CwlJ-like protein
MTLDATAFAIMLTMNIAWNNPVPDSELKCMSHAIYHEAGNQSLQGKVAVAHVIKNRVKHSRFPNSVCDVVKQPSQFSYLNTGNRNHLTIDNDIDKVAFERSMIVALTVMTESVEDITEGATHYINKDELTRIPNWYIVAESKGKFGEHSFVRLER